MRRLLIKNIWTANAVVAGTKWRISMKKLFLFLTLALSSIAYAETWAMVFGSQGDRKLQYEASREHCPRDQRYVFSHEPGESTQVGCWKLVTNGVMITWKTGGSYFHQIGEPSMAKMRELYEAGK